MAHVADTTVSPVVEQNEFAEHKVQLADPRLPWKVPSEQLVHEAAALLEYVPEGQLVLADSPGVAQVIP